MGKMIVIEGNEFLQCGNIIVKEMFGVCANCGSEVSWSVPTRILQRILRNQTGKGRVDVI